MAILVTGLLPMASNASDSSRHYVRAWNASPSHGRFLPLFSSVVRNIITPTSGGNQVRLHLSNRFGTRPVTFSAVYIGRQRSGAMIRAGSNRRVMFDSSGSVTMAAGGSVVSDPVRMDVVPGHSLAVSLEVDGIAFRPTIHAGEPEVSYTSLPGGDASRHDDQGYGLTSLVPGTSWFYITGLDVSGSRARRTVVAFGDSITAGHISRELPFTDPIFAEPDEEHRFTEFLQRRINADPDSPRVSVVNAGLNGNRVLRKGAVPGFGPAGVNRIHDDAIVLPNTRTLIISEGLNDIGMSLQVSAGNIINGLKSMIRQAQNSNKRVILATLTPSAGARGRYGNSKGLAMRQEVNTWIREQEISDDVVDLAQCLADPDDADRLHPAYDSGDHLHPNKAGYKRMASCFDLSMFAE